MITMFQFCAKLLSGFTMPNAPTDGTEPVTRFRN
jgi:hypothetical protein